MTVIKRTRRTYKWLVVSLPLRNGHSAQMNLHLYSNWSHLAEGERMCVCVYVCVSFVCRHRFNTHLCIPGDTQERHLRARGTNFNLTLVQSCCHSDPSFLSPESSLSPVCFPPLPWHRRNRLNFLTEETSLASRLG